MTTGAYYPTAWRVPALGRAGLAGLIAMLVSIVLVLDAGAQPSPQYDPEAKFAAEYVRSTDRSGLNKPLQWASLPNLLRHGFAVDLRNILKANPLKLSGAESLTPQEDSELRAALAVRVYMDYLRRVDSHEIAGIVEDPPQTKLEQPRAVVLRQLEAKFPFTAKVMEHVDVLARTDQWFQPLVLSAEGYKRTAGYYVDTPLNKDTGPSVPPPRKVIVDPVGFREAAFLVLNPTLEANGGVDVVRCSGFLINPDWLITARHCIGGPSDEKSSDSTFAIDDSLIESQDNAGRGFVLVQKTGQTPDSYSRYSKCLDASKASIVAIDKTGCPYFVGQVAEIHTPKERACEGDGVVPCRLVRPDIALVRVAWQKDLKPSRDMAARLLLDDPARVRQLVAREGMTFAGFGVSFKDGTRQMLANELSPLVVGFQRFKSELDLEVATDGLAPTYFEWNQNVATGDGLCMGDSGGPIIAGFVRGHRNTRPHRVFALVSRLSHNPQAAAAGGPSPDVCLRGKVRVLLLAPWRDWICSVAKDVPEANCVVAASQTATR